jgi:hypothetical protein
MEKDWSRSDSLAVALACLAAVMALILFWIDKTPLSAGITIIAMVGLMIYPVIHFVRSTSVRIPVFLTVSVLIGLFGWAVWPKRQLLETPQIVSAPITPPLAQRKPESPAETTPAPTSKRKPQKSHPSTPPPTKEQKCETGSICNQDSPNNGTQTVNNGPPPAKLIWAQFPNERIHELATTKVTIDVDHTLDVPEFIVTCDRPCTTNAMGSGYGGMVAFDHQQRISPTKLKLIFGSPRPMAPGAILWIYLGSDGVAPKILSLERADILTPQ